MTELVTVAAPVMGALALVVSVFAIISLFKDGDDE